LNESGDDIQIPVTGPDGKLTVELGGTQVSINNVPAPILYSTLRQVLIQIPFEVAGQSTASMTVTVAGQTSVARSINIAPAAVGIYTQTQTGTGDAVVMHEDGVTLITPENPAKRNEVVRFYVTGLGVLNPALATGAAAVENAATERVQMTIGAANAVIEYAGGLPDSVGMNQIQARIPVGAPTGSQVPVAITVGERSANPVVIAIGQ